MASDHQAPSEPSNDRAIPANKPVSGRRFATDVFGYLPSSLLPALVAALSAATFTRLFSPGAYGVYSLALAIVVPVTALSTVWVEQPAGRFYAVYEKEGRGQAYRRLIATLVLLLGTGISLLALVVILASAVYQSPVLYPLLVGGGAFMLLTTSISTIVMAVLWASAQIAAYRRAVTISSVLAFIVALAFVLLLHRDVAWILWGQGFGRIAVLPYILKKSRVSLTDPFTRISAEAREMFRRFWRYGGPMMLWYVASTILNSEDRYVIGAFRSTAEVGLYSANYNLIYGLATLLNAPVIIAAGSMLFRQWATGELDAVRRTIANMTELYLIIAFALVGGIAVSGELLALILLGPKFRAGDVIFVPVLAGLIFWGAGIVGHKGLELAERTLPMAGSALAAAAINLILNLVFVPRYGYVAAAYSTLVSYATYVVVIWFQTRRLVPWDVDAGYLALYLGCAAAAFVATLPLTLLVKDFRTASVAGAIISGCIFAAIYALLLWVTSRRRIAVLLNPSS